MKLADTQPSANRAPEVRICCKFCCKSQARVSPIQSQFCGIYPIPTFEYPRDHVLFCMVYIGGEELTCKPQAVSELAGKDRIMCKMMGYRS